MATKTALAFASVQRHTLEPESDDEFSAALAAMEAEAAAAAAPAPLPSVAVARAQNQAYSNHHGLTSSSNAHSHAQEEGDDVLPDSPESSAVAAVAHAAGGGAAAASSSNGDADTRTRSASTVESDLAAQLAAQLREQAGLTHGCGSAGKDGKKGCESAECAAQAKDTEDMVAAIAAANAKVTLHNQAVDDEIARKQAEQTLTGAIFRDDISALQRLLSMGVSPNQFDASSEHSALHHAAYRGALGMVNVLLSAGADVDIRNVRGETPLMWACKTDALTLAVTLLDRGADPVARDHVGLQPLHHAAERGQILIMDALLLRGAPVTAVDGKDKSALHWACYADQTRAVEWLLQEGVDPWIEDCDRCLALHWAFGQGNVETVKLMLGHPEFHPMLDRRNKSGFTPVEFCQERSKREEYEFHRRKYKSCATNAAVLSRWVWIQRSLLCGVIGKGLDFVEHCRGPLVMWNAMLYLFGLVVLFFGTGPTFVSEHPLLVLTCLSFTAASLYCWLRTVLGEPGGLVPWAAPVPGVPSYARLHALYLSALGAPRRRILAALKIDRQYQRRYAALLGHPYQTPNELGLDAAAAAAHVAAHAAPVLPTLNDSDLEDVADSLNLASPYPLPGSPTLGAGTAAALAVALADPTRAPRLALSPQSSVALTAARNLPGGDADDGGVAARCGIVWAGVGVWAADAVESAKSSLGALFSGRPSSGEYSGFGSGAGGDDDDDDDDLEAGKQGSGVSRGAVDTVPTLTTLNVLKMSTPASRNDGVAISASQLCATCRIVRPLRSKHCSKCHRCVAKFDHHCPFLGTDIGAGNHFFFFWYCVTMAMLVISFVVSYSVALTELRAFNGERLGWTAAALASPVTTIWAYHYVLYAILVTALAMQHFGQINGNLSTNESINRSKYSYLSADGMYFNPFDLGVKGNWKTFMGVSPPELTAITLDDALHLRSHRLTAETGAAPGSAAAAGGPAAGFSTAGVGTGKAWQKFRDRSHQDAARALTNLKATTAARTGDASLAAAAAAEAAAQAAAASAGGRNARAHAQHAAADAEFDSEFGSDVGAAPMAIEDGGVGYGRSHTGHGHAAPQYESSLGAGDDDGYVIPSNRGMMHSLGMDEGDLSEL